MGQPHPLTAAPDLSLTPPFSSATLTLPSCLLRLCCIGVGCVAVEVGEVVGRSVASLSRSKQFPSVPRQQPQTQLEGNKAAPAAADDSRRGIAGGRGHGGEEEKEREVGADAAAPAAPSSSASASMSVEELMDCEFERIIGHDELKLQLRQFYKKVQLDRIRQAHGKEMDHKRLYHMIFSGPPGTGHTMHATHAHLLHTHTHPRTHLHSYNAPRRTTRLTADPPPHVCGVCRCAGVRVCVLGKTTMANVVSKLLLRMQLVQSSTVVFVNNSLELLGSYVGQTPMKVDAKVAEAAGGVLFIDEAYSIIKEGGGREGAGASFGKEAIDTLMKHMDPPSCVMIFAGYSKEMEDFLTVNPGLARRIPYRYHFHAYNTQQLMQIFTVMCKAKGETLGGGVEQEVIQTPSPTTHLAIGISQLYPFTSASPHCPTVTLPLCAWCAVPSSVEWCGRGLVEQSERWADLQLGELCADAKGRPHRPQRGGAAAQPCVHTGSAGPRQRHPVAGQNETHPPQRRAQNHYHSHCAAGHTTHRHRSQARRLTCIDNQYRCARSCPLTSTDGGR